MYKIYISILTFLTFLFSSIDYEEIVKFDIILDRGDYRSSENMTVEFAFEFKIIIIFIV